MPRTCRPRSATILPAAGLVLLVLSGCGPSRATVKGTVVFPNDLQLKNDDDVQISFTPEDNKSEGTTSGYGVYNPADKTFVIKTADQKGLPVGKYRVGVQLTAYPGHEDTDQRQEYLDAFNANHGAGAGKLTYEVTGGSAQDITIDLNSNTITKK
jgi:hypothetical protein